MPYDTGKDIADGNASRTSVSDLEDSPLTGNEEQRFQLKQHRKCRPQWPANDSPIWKVWSLIMTVCSLLLLLSTVIHRNNPKPEILASCRTTSPLENYPHPVETWKKENLIETKYYRDLRYMTLDHEADYLWREHVLMATGNIRVPSEDGEENGTLMSISMFHQLHCLAKMRLALQQAREGIDIGVDWRDDAHWPHCFDYLRSSIMCFADGTLERVTLQPGPRDDGTFVKIIDGGVETRYCRDTRPLYELERQYGPNSHYGHDAAEEFQVAPGR
ncbi:hypothetical protein T310_7873 [Rasamsonia emersonii CBS 393.64]|uniref:Tat pathway signal sequence n=1 Tax=Rasamsonia emersonii (strain ATCC 16479 / CBS 393.64 / IMI 116815) TaxID=1408163 RepID=A0A0F4YIY7_RASE3|nr:hypothetical protein T310_7873 [Rasamsonia emersonii CBS 393.64]KKA18174.1 hypothetical protein T310_7873 [Rasamsonia emersonii CBS 393.64]